METSQALRLAKEKDLDLIEVNPHLVPPVCKILDYGKYLYKKEKEIQKQKRKVKGGKIKNIRLSLRISPHDLQTKINQARRFLQAKNRVKIILILRGRELAHLDLAKNLISDFASKFSEAAQIEESLKVERNILSISLKPTFSRSKDEEKNENP